MINYTRCKSLRGGERGGQGKGGGEEEEEEEGGGGGEGGGGEGGEGGRGEGGGGSTDTELIERPGSQSTTNKTRGRSSNSVSQ